jgi:protein-disulfide isomerase
VLQQLAPRYVQTGEAKIIYRNFPIIGPQSVLAAQAAACAADQNKFWVYANDLFAHQDGENSGAFSPGNLKAFAAQLGLDTQTFNACFDRGKYAGWVQQQLQEGQQRGVTATPTFFINGKQYEGVLSYSQLATLIEEGQPH